MTPLPPKPAFSPSSPYWLGARDIYRTMVHLGASNPLAIAALANADMESAFKTAALGDDGTAHSLWQWHGDRAARILAGYGVDVTTETSVVAVTGALVWDISTVKAYQPAFAAMKAATTAEEAAMIFCEKIEGAGATCAKERRAADAAWWTVAIAEHANFFNAPPAPDE